MAKEAPEQIPFPFLEEMDRARLPPNVDGWPILNYGHPSRAGYQSGWVHRRYYPTAQEALNDAKLASERARVNLFVVKHTGANTEVWPEGAYWRISEDAPFSGTAGYFYHPWPDHYIVEPDSMIPVLFIEGEDKAAADKKQRKLDEEFQKLRKG
jgi:hypothetical protein